MSESKPPSRRDFLTGSAALDAISNLAGGNPGSDAPRQHGDQTASGSASATKSDADWGSPIPATYLIEISRSAMACEFQIYLNAGEHPDGADVALQALDLVDQLESQLSVYRPHTEISYINQHAANEPVVTEPQLFALLQQAVELYRETDGAFDITTGPLSKVWGFYRRAGKFPSDAEIADAMTRVSCSKIELAASQRSIRFLHPGIEINLNAIGKGYALDRCASLLLESNVSSFLIHGGQSSILARGSRAGLSADQRGWRVALRNPLRPEKTLAEIWLRDQALGTSGSGTQFFYHEGKRYGHILDPRTGRPSEAVLASTVIAPNAALGDALATAFFVLGVEATQKHCERHPEISALLTIAGRKSGSVEIVPINMPPDSWISRI